MEQDSHRSAIQESRDIGSLLRAAETSNTTLAAQTQISDTNFLNLRDKAEESIDALVSQGRISSKATCSAEALKEAKKFCRKRALHLECFSTGEFLSVSGKQRKIFCVGYRTEAQDFIPAFKTVEEEVLKDPDIKWVFNPHSSFRTKSTFGSSTSAQSSFTDTLWNLNLGNSYDEIFKTASRQAAVTDALLDIIRIIEELG